MVNRSRIHFCFFVQRIVHLHLCCWSCYLFGCIIIYTFFCSMDASEEDGSLGRLVNDDHKKPNCKFKIKAVNNHPHLCLFAIADILPGQELTYNYGTSDWPWRTQVKNMFSPNMQHSIYMFSLQISKHP